MSNHFFSLNHGLANEQNQFAITQATTSTAGDDIELRLADGVSLTRLDVIKALDRLKRMFESGGDRVPGGSPFPVL